MDNQTLSIEPKSGYGFVFSIKSKDGKRYIGQTRSTVGNSCGEKGEKFRGCRYFNTAIKAIGWRNFDIEILEEVPVDALMETMIKWEIKYDTTNPEHGYNALTTAPYNYLFSLDKLPVYCYNASTGEFIRRYETILEAEQDTGCLSGKIQRAISDEAHTVKGYIWKTEKVDHVQPRDNRLHQASSKPIYMYDSKTGEFLREFPSIRDATRQTGYDRATIKNQATRGTALIGHKHCFRTYKIDNLYDESSTTSLEDVDSSESKQE